MNISKIHVWHYHAPCGDLLLGEFEGRLCLCDWLVERHHARVMDRLKRALSAGIEDAESDVIAEVARQLDEYFVGRRTMFSVPLLFVGTDFQKTVWKELLDIPYGETVSYGELACRLGVPAAVRAVANANGANAISVVVPCHRVIGSDHSLTGYGGGIAAKKWLLDLESAI